MTGTAKTFIVRELDFDDLDYIAANLRPADAMELEAASGHRNYRDRLTMSVALSSEVRVVESNGLPILVFGLAPVNEVAAAIWACGTPAVSRHRRALVTEGRAAVARWFSEHPKLRHLVNLTHAGNRLHHRWLEAIGATVLPEEPLGPGGTMFRPFIIEKEDGACAIRA